MKLILCSECWDILKIGRKNKHCECKKSWGKIKDDLKHSCGITEIGGSAIPLAMDNNYLLWATQHWKHDKRTVFIQTWTVDLTTEKCDV